MMRKMLLTGVVLVSLVLNGAMGGLVRASEARVWSRQEGRIIVTRIAVGRGQIALKDMRPFMSGRPSYIMVWSNDREGNDFELSCSEEEFSVREGVNLIFQADDKKDKWLFDELLSGYEVWVDVKSGSLEKNYKGVIEVVSGIKRLEVLEMEKYRLVYTKCVADERFDREAECVRELEQVANWGNLERFYVYKYGVKQEGLNMGLEKWEGEVLRSQTGQSDNIEVDEIKIGENGFAKMRYTEDGEKVAKIKNWRIFWSEMNKFLAGSEQAARKVIYEKESGAKRIIARIGENLKDNYTGVIYVEVEKSDGEKILKRINYANCVGVSEYSKKGDLICKLKKDPVERYVASLNGGELEMTETSAEEWEVNRWQQNNLKEEDYKRALAELAMKQKKFIEENKKIVESAGAVMGDTQDGQKREDGKKIGENVKNAKVVKVAKNNKLSKNVVTKPVRVNKTLKNSWDNGGKEVAWAGRVSAGATVNSLTEGKKSAIEEGKRDEVEKSLIQDDNEAAGENIPVPLTGGELKNRGDRANWWWFLGGMGIMTLLGGMGLGVMYFVKRR